MINPIFTFICGIVSGCIVAGLIARIYWAKKLQVLKQSLLDQYDSDLAVAQQHNRLLENREKQWLQEKADIEQQLEAEKRDRASLQTNYKAYQQIAQAQIQDAKAKIVDVREKGINFAVEQTKDIEAEKRSLLQRIEQLERSLNDTLIQNQELQAQIERENTRLETELKSAYSSTGVTFASIATSLFQNLVIQRGSAVEIDKNRDCASAILRTLRAIDDKKFRLSKKVGATNKAWFESTAPGLKMMRIYFRKNKPIPGKCEVLISHKKDSKTQEKDIDWMKRQHS